MTPENTRKLGLLLLALALLLGAAGELVGAGLFLVCGLVCVYL